MKLSFTKSVGVAPGTTTMSLGGQARALRCANLGEGCPPDPVRYYTDPVSVKSGWSAGIKSAPRGGTMTIYDPYGTESQLKASALAGLRGLGRGLRGLGEARPGVAVIAAVLAFAGVVGYGLFKRRR